jgi:hypothetical protein
MSEYTPSLRSNCRPEFNNSRWRHDTQHNGTQHYAVIYDIQHTGHSKQQCHYAGCRVVIFSIIMQNVLC